MWWSVTSGTSVYIIENHEKGGSTQTGSKQAGKKERKERERRIKMIATFLPLEIAMNSFYICLFGCTFLCLRLVGCVRCDEAGFCMIQTTGFQRFNDASPFTHLGLRILSTIAYTVESCTKWRRTSYTHKPHVKHEWFVGVQCASSGIIWLYHPQTTAVSGCTMCATICASTFLQGHCTHNQSLHAPAQF